MAQTIIIAHGIQTRDLGHGILLRDFLDQNADAQKGSRWTFPMGAKTAKVEVSVVYTMPEFKTALDTPDVYVVYEGHSRYGQGPSFGDAKMPNVPDVKKYLVNPWGVHFRMGYEATDTECIDDLLTHSVVANEYDLLAATSKSFLPSVLTSAAARAQEVDARESAGKLTAAEKKNTCDITGRWRAFNGCDPVLAKEKTTRGDQPLMALHFFMQQKGKRKPKTPEDEYLTAVQVGSADLDTSSLKCKVLFMASCSSKVHYHEPLKKRRTAAKSACKFYLTANLCAALHGKNFIAEVFKGTDPTTAKGSKEMLKTLNGADNAGAVGFY